MNVLVPPQLQLFPHQHETARLSPPRSMSPFSYNMANRKRKADDDSDEMSVSPHSSPAVSARQLSRPSKKARAGDDALAARPLPLPRLLETLNADELRNVLVRICESRPEIGQEVVGSAPRPTPASSLKVLAEYQDKLKAAVPYGESSAEYTYFRVKGPLVALVNAISDFTLQYLPPLETQTATSLQFLDGATKVIHALPDWEPQAYRQHKDDAYDEISRAWELVINEATKRGGGFNLHLGPWGQRLQKHHQLSGERMGAAMNAMNKGAMWTGSQQNNNGGSLADQSSILNQVLSGTYGAPVRVGPF